MGNSEAQGVKKVDRLPSAEDGAAMMTPELFFILFTCKRSWEWGSNGVDSSSGSCFWKGLMRAP